MKDNAFDQLPQTEDGLPIVTLMTDPDQAGDGAGFLSLVTRGANGRRMQVLKTAEPAKKVEDMQPELEVTLDLGQASGFMASFRSIFAALIGSEPQLTLGSKADAVSFNEAIVIPQVFERMWDGYDALERSVSSIMRDENVHDKQQRVEIELTGFEHSQRCPS